MNPWTEPLMSRRNDEMLAGNLPWPEVPPRRVFLGNLSTITPAVFQCFLLIAQIATAVTFKWNGTTFSSKCSNLNVLLLFQIAVWAVSYLLDHYYQDQHRKLRVCGRIVVYNSLHRRSVSILSLLSWANALTIAYLAYSVNYASDELCDWSWHYSALNLSVILGVANGIVVLCILFSYIRKVWNFNTRNPNYVLDIDPLEVWRRGEISPTRDGFEYDVDELLRLLEQQRYTAEFYKEMLEIMGRNLNARR